MLVKHRLTIARDPGDGSTRRRSEDGLEQTVVEERVERQGCDKTDDQKCEMEIAKTAAKDESLDDDEIERHQSE